MAPSCRSSESVKPFIQGNPELGGPASVWRRGWQVVQRNLAQSFTVDLRSLAALRIGLGILVLADAALALSNAELLYSDTGVLPRTLMYERHWPAVTSWSIHALSGSVGFQAGLMVLQMMAALWLIGGRFTRLATLCCWLLVCSLETRNPAIVNGADAMTRLLLFWGIFLPLGATWSLDSWRVRDSESGGRGHTLRSVAGASLLLQVAFVYWFSVICKSHPCWWGDGSALVQTLQLDLFARPFAVWLRAHPDLCQAVTYGWLVVEIVGPLLAFLPFWRTGFRIVAVAMFAAYHAGIELCMDIGAFPYVMIVAWMAFVPGAAWEWLGAKLKKGQGDTGVSELEEGRAADSSQDWKPHPLANAFCLACLAFVFMWNLRGTNFAYWEQVFPRSVNPVAFALRLDQHWSMFAPRPTSEDGWFVLRAGMSDGAEIDLLHEGQPADFQKPALVSATFKDARWQKILMNIWLEEYRHLREAFGDALAHHWNRNHGGLSQVVAWQLWYMMEPTLPDGSAGKVKPCLLFEKERFGNVPQRESSSETLSASSP